MKISTTVLFTIGALLILFSPSLGELFIDTVYAGKNLTGEYTTLLSGSITAFLWLGIIASAIGLIPLLTRKSN